MKKQKLEMRWKRLLTSLTAFFCMAFWQIQGFAASTASSTDGIDPQKAISSLAGFFLSIMQGVGVIAVIWGVICIVLRFTWKNLNLRNWGILFISVGVMLILLNFILEILGVNV